jgi:hypothetical protein
VHGDGFIGQAVNDVISRTSGQLSLLGVDEPIVYGLNMVRPEDRKTVGLYEVKPGKVAGSILTIESGMMVNLPLIKSPLDIEYEVANGASLQRTALMKDRTSATACFDIRSAQDSSEGELRILQKNRVTRTIQISSTYQHVTVNMASGEIIQVVNDRGFTMRINNLDGGCGAT